MFHIPHTDVFIEDHFLVWRRLKTKCCVISLLVVNPTQRQLVSTLLLFASRPKWQEGTFTQWGGGASLSSILIASQRNLWMWLCSCVGSSSERGSREMTTTFSRNVLETLGNVSFWFYLFAVQIEWRKKRNLAISFDDVCKTFHYVRCFMKCEVVFPISNFNLINNLKI